MNLSPPKIPGAREARIWLDCPNPLCLDQADMPVLTLSRDVYWLTVWFGLAVGSLYILALLLVAVAT